MGSIIRRGLVLVNAGTAATSIAVWAKMQSAPTSEPIAWICASLQVNGYTTFAWETAYQYLWANTGHLTPGKTVAAAQRVPVSDRVPAVRLEKQNTHYRLVPFTPSPALPPGDFLIETDGNVPQDQVTIGINLRIISGFGQPGNGTSVVQAEPNVSRRWSAGETYFAGFGGVVQSEFAPKSLSTQTPLEIDFSTGATAGLILDSSNVLRQMTRSDLSETLRAATHDPGLKAWIPDIHD